MKEKNLTKEEKRKRFYNRLKTQGSDIEESYAVACFRLERDVGVVITPEYPASKFVIQCEYLGKDKKDEAKQFNTMRGKGSRTFR